MPTIADTDVIRCRVSPRSPFRLLDLPLLSRVHLAGFRPRKRLSRRLIGKPARRLFRWLLDLGIAGTGHFSVSTPDGERRIAFNGRNTQFSALYLPQNLPVYEAETTALLDAMVGDDGVFFDIGSNWGWFALLIGGRPGFRGQVHAFEPFPATFRDLDAVVSQAGLQARIRCHAVALAARDGEAMMGISDGMHSGLASLGATDGARVTMARLDSLGLPAPQAIKIDVEDHELEVLQGAAATIDAARPYIVFENWLHPRMPQTTLGPLHFLAGRDYRFFYPGWVQADPDCIRGGNEARTDHLALVPLLPAQRFELPRQLNIVAVPAEKLSALRNRLGAA
jgi:FkbM family methyltransferase